ncbi:hypothetical protein INQ51_15615 [Maribellus sp. CM-23]|uniref:hypothetical protein n=1 Tax=Maribellus sp. CM-23 TaxID=2781026 RepID=UPI001F26CCFC|nr:hypothetical protein [Maribellus sp. CM-23]MCE4565748.1 hypothetical protein [Maribellus sp. CM-23]
MKTVLYWLIAVVITLSAMAYQRTTGPTKDKRVKITIENKEYKLRLTRSHGGESDCKIQLLLEDENIGGTIFFKPFPSKNEWTEQGLTREGTYLVATLPHLPPAGKYEYKITLTKGDQSFRLNDGMPVIIRFKGHVPAGILVPHIFVMFFAMFLGNLAGTMALFKHKRFKFYTTLMLITLFIGGMILGPLVQLYAFGEAWAGIPFAWDLTDNKTLVAFLFWILAFAMNRKQERPFYTVLAAVVMLLVYSIPHSMYGSELDPETGEIIQGWIQLFVYV